MVMQLNDGGAYYRVVTRFEEATVSQFFIQDGNRIEPPTADVEGVPETNTINEEYCSASSFVFGTRDEFAEVGGIDSQNDMLNRPLVLAMSIYDDVSFISFSSFSLFFSSFQFCHTEEALMRVEIALYLEHLA